MYGLENYPIAVFFPRIVFFFTYINLNYQIAGGGGGFEDFFYINKFFWIYLQKHREKLQHCQTWFAKNGTLCLPAL